MSRFRAQTRKSTGNTCGRTPNLVQSSALGFVLIRARTRSLIPVIGVATEVAETVKERK